MGDKDWHDPNGIRRHLVEEVYCSATDAYIVVSRSWRKRHQRWDYHAEPAAMVEFYKKLNAERFE